MERPKIRLCVDQPLGAEQIVPVTREQAHYLFGVMRLTVGGFVALFDGQNGEWRAEITEAGKRGGTLRCVAQSAPQLDPPDLWLIFAPIKKARTDFIVEKAAEMGASRILPVQTDFTNSERIRRDRLQAHAVEAAEQCGGTYVPEVADLTRLDRLLADWSPDRQLMFCDEDLADGAANSDPATAEPNTRGMAGLALHRGAPWAILIGPEGGFSDAERHRLRGLPFAHPVGLGPRILRADTAAVAAMALWQDQLGDW